MVQSIDCLKNYMKDECEMSTMHDWDKITGTTGITRFL